MNRAARSFERSVRSFGRARITLLDGDPPRPVRLVVPLWRASARERWEGPARRGVSLLLSFARAGLPGSYTALPLHLCAEKHLRAAARDPGTEPRARRAINRFLKDLRVKGAHR